MDNFSNPKYLRTKQYKTADNLNARIDLHRRFSVNRSRWHKWVFEQFKFAPQSHLLELGSGPGYLWSENINRVPQTWEITLSDLSIGMLAVTGQQLAGQKQFRRLACNAQQLPLCANIFDAVIANHMLYHLPNIEKALSEIARVLKPGSVFYATTNSSSHLKEIWQWVKEALPNSSAARNISTSWLNGELSFGLENGEHLLKENFGTIKMIRYEHCIKMSLHNFVIILNLDSINWESLKLLKIAVSL